MFAVLDPLLIPLVVGAHMVLCAAVVCVVALVRADRRDVVEVVRALPELAAVMIRWRRHRK
ncbi:hypothetical protein ACUN22_17300 [Streptomyces anulatus]|uniref:hypothetical protein n=1 Tax=Streptomyces anulatus TaxID=1892 RepID=UPI00403E1F22